MRGAALELIRTKSRKRVLTATDFAKLSSLHVLPSTDSSFSAGGILSGSSAGLGPGQVVVEAADLNAILIH